MRIAGLLDPLGEVAAANGPIDVAGSGFTRQVWDNPGGEWPLAGVDDSNQPLLWVALEGVLIGQYRGSTYKNTLSDNRLSLLMFGTQQMDLEGAWGVKANSPTGTAERYVYAGMRLLPGPTGTVGSPFSLAQHRVYDPKLGRFLSVDPMGRAGGDNGFVYANGEPTRFVDPWGLSAAEMGGSRSGFYDEPVESPGHRRSTGLGPSPRVGETPWWVPGKCGWSRLCTDDGEDQSEEASAEVGAEDAVDATTEGAMYVEDLDLWLVRGEDVLVEGSESVDPEPDESTDDVADGGDDDPGKPSTIAEAPWHQNDGPGGPLTLAEARANAHPGTLAMVAADYRMSLLNSEGNAATYFNAAIGWARNSFQHVQGGQSPSLRVALNHALDGAESRCETLSCVAAVTRVRLILAQTPVSPEDPVDLFMVVALLPAPRVGVAVVDAVEASVGVGAGQKYILRGVSANHPEIAAARQGRVVPGNLAGTVTEEAHNLGGVAADSPFTSWTHDPKVAAFHAAKDGPGGVILQVPVGAPPPGATWSWSWSPDVYGESEVLLRGVREGAEVITP